MKPSPLRWLAFTAAAVAAILCWYLLTMEPDPTSRMAWKDIAPAALVTGKGFASSPAEPLPKFGTPEFKSALHERGKKYLDSRGRDAEGLIAMWEITGDDALLTEAAEKFPDEPRVCIMMIYNAGKDTEKAMPWIEKLIAGVPWNTEGYYQKAWALASNNDSRGTVAALRDAATAGGLQTRSDLIPGAPDEYLSDRMESARDAALACGVSPGDAVRLALSGPLQHRTHSRMLEGVTNVLSGILLDAKASGNWGRVEAIVELGLLTADRYYQMPPATLTDRYQAMKLKAAMRPDSGQDRLLLDMHRVKIETEARDTAPLLQSASDRVMVEYFIEYRLAGEIQAGESLKATKRSSPQEWPVASR